MSMQCRASPEPPVSVEGDERERGGERGAEEADELRRREPADVRVECRRGEGSDDRADRVETVPQRAGCGRVVVGLEFGVGLGLG